MTEFEPPDDDREETAIYHDAITACRHRIEKEYGPVGDLLVFTHPHDFHDLLNNSRDLFRPEQEVEEVSRAIIRQTREVPKGMVLTTLDGTFAFPEALAIEHLDDHRTI